MPLGLSWRPAVRVQTALLAGMLCLLADARAKSQSLVPQPAGGMPFYVDCRGKPSASPTVILESGLFGAADDWDWVLDDLAKGGRVCTYDRAGLGPSKAKPGAQDVDGINIALAAMLDGLGEKSPVILAGHSNGALYAEGFAARWPQRVAGLLYINGVNSDDLDYPLLVKDMQAENRLAKLAVTVFRMGLGPVIAAIIADDSGLRPPAASSKRKILSRLGHMEVGLEEDLAMIPGMKTVRAEGGSPTAIPTAVIVGATDPKSDISKAWRAAGAGIVAKAKTGWLLTADGATHTSPLARDRAYVDAAVTWLRTVHAARAHPSSQTPSPTS